MTIGIVWYNANIFYLSGSFLSIASKIHYKTCMFVQFIVKMYMGIRMMKKQNLFTLLFTFLMLTFVPFEAHAEFVRDVTCGLSDFYYDNMWIGILTLAATFSFMMLLLDRVSFSMYNNFSSPILKLKFRYTIWLPILQFSLYIFALCLVRLISFSDSFSSIIICMLFLTFIFRILWENYVILSYSPLKKDGSLLDPLDLEKIKPKDLIHHFIIFCATAYGSVLIIFYIIAYFATQYNCIIPAE